MKNWVDLRCLWTAFITCSKLWSHWSYWRPWNARKASGAQRCELKVKISTSSVRKVLKCRYGRQFKLIPVCQKKFRLHFWNPRPFICLFDIISLHRWRRLLGVIFIWKQKVENDMCHFASFSWLVAAKYAEVIFFALQIIGKGNNQGVAAN